MHLRAAIPLLAMSTCVGAMRRVQRVNSNQHLRRAACGVRRLCRTAVPGAASVARWAERMATCRSLPTISKRSSSSVVTRSSDIATRRLPRSLGPFLILSDPVGPPSVLRALAASPDHRVTEVPRLGPQRCRTDEAAATAAAAACMQRGRTDLCDDGMATSGLDVVCDLAWRRIVDGLPACERAPPRKRASDSGDRQVRHQIHAHLALNTARASTTHR